MKFYEHIFSVKNRDSYWLVRTLGIKWRLKINRKVVYSPLWDGRNAKFETSRLFKVAFYLGRQEGSSVRYRVDNLVEALTRKGIIADKYYDTDLSLLKNRTEYDVLVIFRSGDTDDHAYQKVVETIKNFRSAKKPVIYDADDYVLLESRYGRDIVRRMESLIRMCSAVTTTTAYLADRLKSANENVFVIRNTINYAQYEEAARLLKRKRPVSQEIKIVYQSGSDTHNKDFPECIEALADILDRYPSVELHLLGPLKVDKAFSQKYASQIVRVDLMPYMDLLSYVVDMDINIAPLQHNSFNNSKSELKIFESALLKVPSVVSGTASYAKAIEQGHNGFVANTRKEWFESLSKLIEDAEFRKTMAENAWREITPKFYIENEIDGIISFYRSCAHD